MVFIWNYVSDKGLETLKVYKYSGIDNCLTTKILNDYWNWVLTITPIWIAPNVLTLLGGICILLALGMVIISRSWYVLLFASFLIFAYQTLDSVDGKQARKTHSSSPLGELMDHGVDAIVFAAFGPMVSIIADCPLIFSLFGCLLVLPAFWLPHWEHYHKGVMEFGTIGPCEIHWLVIFFTIFSAFIGTPVWHLQIPGIPLVVFRTGFTILVGSCAILSSFSSIYNVYLLYKKDSNSTEKFLKAIQRLTPLAVFLILSSLRIIAEQEVVKYASTALFISNGILFAFITQRLMVQRLFKEPFILFYPIFIPLSFCILNGFFNILPQIHVAWGMVVLSIVQESIFAISFIKQISGHLHIHPFKITQKEN